MLQCGKPFFARNTTEYKIRKLHGTIFSIFSSFNQRKLYFERLCLSKNYIINASLMNERDGKKDTIYRLTIKSSAPLGS